MGKIMYKGNEYAVNIEEGNHNRLTQAQYDALSQAEKQNGDVYFITDGVPGSSLPMFNLFYPIGTCYETDNQFFNPNISWDGTWVLEDEHIIEKKKLLWTNSDITVAFIAQTINLNLSSFDEVEIKSIVSASSGSNKVDRLRCKIDEGMRTMFRSASSTTLMWRDANVFSDHIDFTIGHDNDTQNDNRAIPMEIYGIKSYTRYCWRRTA